MNILNLIQLSPFTAKSLQLHDDEIKIYPAQGENRYFVSRISLENLIKNKIPFQLIRHYQKKDVPIDIAYPPYSYLFDAPEPEAINEVLTYAMAKYQNSKTHHQILYAGRYGVRKKPEIPNAFVLDRPGGKRQYAWVFPRRSQKVQDFRDQFSRISTRIKDPNTKVIISFGSGGVRMFAHAALMKFIDILGLRNHIAEVWGTSGGSIAGLNYSLGVNPTAIEQEGYHIYNDRYSLRLSPNKFDVIKNILVDTFNPASNHLIQGFLDCQNEMQKVFGKHFDKPSGKKKIPFYCIAYNLHSKRSEVLTPEAGDYSQYPMPILQTSALDAIIASSSIPIIYVPKKILRGTTEHVYVDGGTTEEVPLISPYRKWVYERKHRIEPRRKLLIIFVNLFPQVSNSSFFTHWLVKKIPAFHLLQLSATYADLIRQAKIEEHKDQLMLDKNVDFFELVLPIPGVAVVDPKLIPKIIETAQTSFFEQLMKIERTLSLGKQELAAKVTMGLRPILNIA